MKRISAHELATRVGKVDVISVDVFDTLLLRTRRSERTRIALGEQRFSALLARRGHEVHADLLIEARLEAQRLAFRALDVGGAGEVRLVDVIERQLKVLGLPPQLASDRLSIEVDVEKTSLVANEALARLLRAHRSAGRRAIAVSDTTLPEHALRELIEHFHGPDLIQRVYSSASHQKTKRRGELFDAVRELEGVAADQMVHVGDDQLADVDRAIDRGLTAHHAPRAPLRGLVRRGDGAWTEARRVLRRGRPRAGDGHYHDPLSFGREVLGPITAQFCHAIWLYAAQAETTHRPVLLFCARGGIGIREAFELALPKLGLQTEVRRETLMVSRVVAARAALLSRSGAAVQELDREFSTGTLADAARALGEGEISLGAEWHAPFVGEAFLELLFAPSGAQVLAGVRRQNDLFHRHFMRVVADANRIILCDTGLYGSTQRMLAAGTPELAIEAVQLARSNYKGHGEEHFPRVCGLLVERTGYSPLDVRSSVLRYWHLVESLFEPAVPSVRTFRHESDGGVSANCGEVELGALDPTHNNPLLKGALEYIRELPEGEAAARVMQRDVRVAWQKLKRAITMPTSADVSCLAVDDRSVDFGRMGRVEVVSTPDSSWFGARLMGVKSQLWREGAITKNHPLLKQALLPIVESIQSARALQRVLRAPFATFLRSPARGRASTSRTR